MHFGLRTKVITFASCLVVAIIGINAAVMLHTEKTDSKKQLEEQGKLFAKLTATEVVHTYGSLSWESGGKQDVRTQMLKFFRYYPDLVRLTIISQSGLILWDSGGAPGHTPVVDEALLKRLPSNGIDTEKYYGPDGEEYMDILAPAAENGGPQFLKVRYIISYRSLKQRLVGIRKQFLLLTVIFMFVGVFTAAAFAAKLINPILALKESARAIEGGDLDQAVELDREDELGELGRSFNSMAGALKGHRRDLEEANRNLLAANEELRLLQTELVRSERMAAVGQLAAGLSHEIDNPIGVIMGFAELLLEDTPPEDPRREDLARILDESRRCKRIVRGLLDFSRPPALGVVPTDLAEALGQTVEAAKTQRLFRDVRINLDSSPVPKVMADPDRLRQVFMNLMINSAQAMPDGGNIDIKLRHEEAAGEVRISFCDSGPGISPENMERIFEPFYTTKRPGEGTGLGLPICVRLLEEHGGRVWVESASGKGATFTVSLPDGQISDEVPGETDGTGENS